MEFLQILENRRSIRAYSEGITVSREEIEQMITAAQQAPSWKNSQTGRYYVALSEEAISEVRNNCLASFNYDRTLNAAAFVLMTFKSGISGFSPDGLPTDTLANGWGAYDLGLQNANFILRAFELGYDTLIMGLRDENKLRDLFDIPDEEIVVSLVAIGKRKADPEKPVRKDISDISKFI